MGFRLYFFYLNNLKKDSAEAAQFLHSDIVLQENDKPRGSCL